MVLVGLVLSYAKVLKKHNINFQQCLVAHVIDISNLCVYMTYIQLSLFGIPAIVYCGDTLSLNIRFKMETPLYFLQYWKFRKLYKNTQNGNIQNEQYLFKEATIKGNSQISLW